MRKSLLVALILALLFVAFRLGRLTAEPEYIKEQPAIQRLPAQAESLTLPYTYKLKYQQNGTNGLLVKVTFSGYTPKREKDSSSRRVRQSGLYDRHNGKALHSVTHSRRRVVRKMPEYVRRRRRRLHV